jgi:hypothetical protein
MENALKSHPLVQPAQNDDEFMQRFRVITSTMAQGTAMQPHGPALEMATTVGAVIVRPLVNACMIYMYSNPATYLHDQFGLLHEFDDMLYKGECSTAAKDFYAARDTSSSQM